MSEWYYSDYERNRLGPVAAGDLAELHQAGQLQPDTLVWREGMPQWRPWRDMMGQALNEAAGRPRPDAAPLSAGVNPYAMAETVAAPAGAAPPAAAPARAADAAMPSPGTLALAGTGGATLAVDTPYGGMEPHSPYAPPRAAVQDGSDYVDGGDIVYAGFWKRVAASVIDSFVLLVVIAILAMVMGVAGAISGLGGGGASAGTMATVALFYLFEIFGIALYFAMMHASGLQATLGKLAVGIKVTDDGGQRISFWRGVGRYFAYLLSSLVLGIGYLMAAFTDRKRGLHDMICSTLVVDRWAFTAHPERQREELGTVTIVVLVLGALAALAYLGLIVALIVGLSSMAN